MLLVALVPGKISSTYIWNFILVITPPASCFALVFNYKVVEQLCVISGCTLGVAIPGSSLYCDWEQGSRVAIGKGVRMLFVDGTRDSNKVTDQADVTNVIWHYFCHVAT